MAPLHRFARRLFIFAALIAGFAALGRFGPAWLEKAGWLSQPTAEPAPAPFERPPVDTARYAPLLKDTALGPYGKKFLVPMAATWDLAPGQVRRRRGYWEILLPQGKPIHEYALDFEERAPWYGVLLREGKELVPLAQRVQYRLSVTDTLAPGPPPAALNVRLSLGRQVLPGAGRVAWLVDVNADSMKATDWAALAAFRWPLTLALSAADSLSPSLWENAAGEREAVAKLPMEPGAYPYVKPGPGALFIHHGPEEVKRLLAEHLAAFPDAAGFLTVLGDRAIENRPLLEPVFAFLAVHGLVWLDATGSPRSLSSALGGERGVPVHAVQPLDLASTREPGLLIARLAARARKSGTALALFRYDRKGFAAFAEALSLNEDRLEDAGIAAVKLSELDARPETE